MNKYDIINNIIVNLDRMQVQGIAAMNTMVNTVRDLNTLAQMLQQEDEAKEDAKEAMDEDQPLRKEND